MIYTNNSEYKVYFYRNSNNGRVPVLEYIRQLSVKERIKVGVYIKFLCDHGGVLDEPYSRYIGSGIRELRVDFFKNRHRIFYITVQNKKIILLHAFLKKSTKTPRQEINRAFNNLENYKINKNLIGYEKEK
jgi:phage-related protein